MAKSRGAFGAADIGGSTGRFGVFDTLDPDSLIEQLEFPMTKTTDDGPGDFNADFDHLVEAIKELRGRHGHLRGLSVAIAGNLDAKRRKLIGAGNLAHWLHKEIARMLYLTFGIRPLMANDAEAAGFYEGLHGHGRGKLFWLNIWGTGFGSCLVDARGEIVTVFRGEGGHQLVYREGNLRCKCGQMNCLEAYIGGDSLDKGFGAPAWQNMRESDWLRVADHLSVGLRNQLCFIPTDEIIFSGGIVCKQAWLLEEVQAILEQDLTVVRAAKLKLSASGEGAGVRGALALQNGRALLV